MLVYALIAFKMVRLADFVVSGYDDAKAAAETGHGRAAYSQKRDFWFREEGPFICEGMVAGGFVMVVVGTVTSSRKEELRQCLLDVYNTTRNVLQALNVAKVRVDMLNARLGPILQECLERYNVTREEVGTTKDPNILKIKNDLAVVNAVMRENIHKALDRGDQLDRLNDNTEGLVSSTILFQKQAGRLKRKMFCEKWRKFVFIFLLVCVGVGVIVLLVMHDER